jgi:hypothetical protein
MTSNKLLLTLLYKQKRGLVAYRRFIRERSKSAFNKHGFGAEVLLKNQGENHDK